MVASRRNAMRVSALKTHGTESTAETCFLGADGSGYVRLLADRGGLGGTRLLIDALRADSAGLLAPRYGHGGYLRG